MTRRQQADDGNEGARALPEVRTVVGSGPPITQAFLVARLIHLLDLAPLEVALGPEPTPHRVHEPPMTHPSHPRPSS